MLNSFEKQLKQTNLAQNTIVSYLHSLKQYIDMYDGVFTKKNLLSYKGFLLEKYKPKTVNLRILAINKYLEFNKLEKLKLKMIKVQQKTFLENVISDADYKFFKNKLKKDGRINWYFIVRYLAATGARISELVQIKIEHVYIGYIDIYSCFDPIFEPPIDFLEECRKHWETAQSSFRKTIERKIGNTWYVIETECDGNEPLADKVKRLIFSDKGVIC